MNAHGARVRLCARAFCVRLYDEKEGVQKMADLIDREAAIKALSHGEGCGNICSRAIRRIPAVDAVPVRRGRWIPHITKDGYKAGYDCSVCGVWLVMPNGLRKYCCDCGALMDGGETE